VTNISGDDLRVFLESNGNNFLCYWKVLCFDTSQMQGFLNMAFTDHDVW